MTEPANPSPKAAAGHRSRTYERPDFPFRCGRERLWSSPCGRGPNADGSCGGISECLPTRQGDRWRCSRPLWAGGPCRHGPRPDGSCYIQRPPCRPQSSSPVRRRRAGLIAAGASIAAIAVFFSTSPGLFGFDRNLIVPGPLTAAHANLIDGTRCDLCHEGHEREGLQLMQALFEHQDMSARCSECHGFDGQSRRPHNLPARHMSVAESAAPAEIGCIGCHTEHEGSDADISRLPDANCQGCHAADRRFERFADGGEAGHPPFPAGFGSLARFSIAFDHAEHFDVHFRKAEVEARRPASCTACHETTGAGGVTSPSFERGCADCHEASIRDEPLVLLTWPEMEAMAQPDSDLAERCGIDAAIDTEDFEPVSYELPDLTEAFLMGIDPDDIGGYDRRYQQLGGLLAAEGVQPLADLVRARQGDPDRLLAGLAPETVAGAACRWIFNQEYDGLETLEAGGWIAEPLGLLYRPGGHGDPVVEAWLHFAARVVGDGWAAAFRDRLFDREAGPGLCASCHAPPGDGGMVWTSAPRYRRHSLFDHRPHLALDEAAGNRPCATCHEIAEAPSNGPNFRAIGLATCRQCHGDRGARDACTTCHRYHPVMDTKS